MAGFNGKNKIGLQFDGLEQMIKQLDAVEGDLKATTEKALIASKQLVNAELKRVTVPANYPAQGKYSRKTHNTADSIDEDMTVSWTGTVGEIPVGYDTKIAGLAPIFLIRGTPYHDPVPPIVNALFGSKIKKQIKEIQRQVFADEIKKKMG